jgi:hypothetical protein
VRIEAQEELVNSVGRTPPLGWDSWNRFHCNPGPTDTLIRQIADGMVSSGMAAAGYPYVVIDDCWSLARRDGNGDLQVDLARFPSGMRAVGDYVHSKGLEFGIYASIGTSAAVVADVDRAVGPIAAPLGPPPRCAMTSVLPLQQRDRSGA